RFLLPVADPAYRSDRGRLCDLVWSRPGPRRRRGLGVPGPAARRAGHRRHGADRGRRGGDEPVFAGGSPMSAATISRRAALLAAPILLGFAAAGCQPAVEGEPRELAAAVAVPEAEAPPTSLPTPVPAAPPPGQALEEPEALLGEYR